MTTKRQAQGCAQSNPITPLSDTLHPEVESRLFSDLHAIDTFDGLCLARMLSHCIHTAAEPSAETKVTKALFAFQKFPESTCQDSERKVAAVPGLQNSVVQSYSFCFLIHDWDISPEPVWPPLRFRNAPRTQHAYTQTNCLAAHTRLISTSFYVDYSTSTSAKRHRKSSKRASRTVHQSPAKPYPRDLPSGEVQTFQRSTAYICRLATHLLGFAWR